MASHRNPSPDSVDKTQLLSAVGQAVIATDLAGTVTYWNRAAEELYGWSAEETVGQNIIDITPAPANREQAAEIMAHLVAGKPWSGEFHVRRQDGTTFPAIVTDRPFYDAAGNLSGIVGVTTDITEHAAAEREAWLQDRRLAEILESISDAFFALDEDLTVTYFNRAAEQVLGRHREEVLGRMLFDAFPEARGSIFEEKYRWAIRAKQAVSFTTEFQQPPYENWYMVNVYPQSNGISVYFQAITEQKRVESQLHTALQSLQVVFDAFPLGIVVTDSNGFISELNAEAERLLGPARVGREGRRLDEDWGFIRPDGRPLLPQDYAGVRASRERRVVRGVEMGIHRLGQDRVWLSATAAPLEDGRVVVAYQDITRLKQAEAEAAHERSLLHSLLEYSPDAIYFKDVQHRLIRTSSAKAEHQGLRPEDMVGKTDFDLYPREQAEAMVADDEHVLRTEEPIVGKVEKVTHPDGSEHWLSVTKMPRYDLSGNLVGTVGISHDVTDLRNLQDELRHQERLAAVGRLAGGIAHDFNNLLGAITLYAQLPLNKHAGDLPADVERSLTTILSESRKAANLVNQILDFSRRAMLRTETLDLAAFSREVMEVLRPTIPENINLRFRIGCTSCVVEVDTIRLQQALINLAVNARDAMPDGGDLIVGVRLVRTRPHEDPPVEDMEPGLWALLSVSDTGCGMTDEVKAHVFEPFFTTKEPGKGTGLGLSQVYGIVKQHHGYIGVESQVGRGTTFDIYLPSVENGVEESQDDALESLYAGDGELILFVEDQQALRVAVAEILTSVGYRVMAAADGREAVELALTEQPDLLITDMVLPQMSGPAILSHMKQIYPEIRSISVTGYTLDVESGSLESAGFDASVTKPFDIEDLLRAIGAVLA